MVKQSLKKEFNEVIRDNGVLVCVFKIATRCQQCQLMADMQLIRALMLFIARTENF